MMHPSSLLVFALLINLIFQSVTLGLPASRIKDDATNLNGFSAVMDGDPSVKEAAPDDFFLRRFPLIDGRLTEEDGTMKIFILSDLGSKGASGSDASSGFGRVFPALSSWRIDRGLAAAQKDEWHNADNLIPMAKRDLDNKLLRCMIGRVYRPCWQISR